MLYPTGFSVSTDGITMRDVVGMPNGLTFMYGNDGDIYELIYAAKDGWFSNKCQVSNLTGAVGASLGVLAGLVPEFLKSNTEGELPFPPCLPVPSSFELSLTARPFFFLPSSSYRSCRKPHARLYSLGPLLPHSIQLHRPLHRRRILQSRPSR